MDNRVLQIPQYDIEIYDWHTGQYLADISGLVGGLTMDWYLNDVETLDFDLDLIQFEIMCHSMGVSPDEILTPYVHDVRIRRNGAYIAGYQIVETNISIDNESSPTIQVRCTGFLNLFKDQYISEPMAGYTYPVMAHKLINRAQLADPIIKNPTFDIDTSYWLSSTSTLSAVESLELQWVTLTPKGGKRFLQARGIGDIGAGTQMTVPAGTPIHVDLWAAGTLPSSGTRDIVVVEREFIGSGSIAGVIATQTVTQGGWYHIEADYTTQLENGYIYIYQNRGGTTSVAIDSCFVWRTDDEDQYYDLNVKGIFTDLSDNENGEGHNYATTEYVSDREYNYQLQNVKDALMDLTQMEDDKFDFEFTYDRVFNTYSRKGADKPEIEVVYPGNVHSMTISRTAADLANKLQYIGSGIGDERLETIIYDNDSRLRYGNRESVVTANNVQELETLKARANGLLQETKEPTNLPQVVIRDGSINPGNVQVGDSIMVRIENGDSYLNTINGMYRVLEMSVSTTLENVETVTLTLELDEDES